MIISNVATNLQLKDICPILQYAIIIRLSVTQKCGQKLKDFLLSIACRRLLAPSEPLAEPTFKILKYFVTAL